MQVKNFSNCLTYISYSCWATIWETRGYLPSDQRTANTAANKHRALHKPVMNSEKLVYNEELDCFELYWGYRVNIKEKSACAANLIFRCYRNFWELYPNDNDGGWLARGKIARINKYCPLQSSWMHIKNGYVQVYGWGKIENGFVLTKTRANSQARHTVHGLRLGIQTALDYATTPGAAASIGTRREYGALSMPPHMPHYTRDQISQIVDYYINQQIAEFCNKLIYHPADEERTAHKYKGTCGFYNHPITLQTRGVSGPDPELHEEDYLAHITNLGGPRCDFSTSSFSLLNALGLHLSNAEENSKPRLQIVGPRFPFSTTMQVPKNQGYRHWQESGTNTNRSLGARNLVKHIISYCYYQSTVYPSQVTKKGKTLKVNDNRVFSSHALLFLPVLLYCENSLHDFEYTFKRLLGQGALDFLNDHDLAGAMPLLSGRSDPELYSPDRIEMFSSFWNLLFEDGLFLGMAEDLNNKTSDTSYCRLQNAIPEIRAAMKSFFREIIQYGVDYKDFGFSPLGLLAVQHPDNGSEHAIDSSIQCPLLDASTRIEPTPATLAQIVCTGVARDPTETITALSQLSASNENDDGLRMVDDLAQAGL